MTDAERALWHRLRGEQLGVRFRRQHPYLQFVLDFVCLERRLIVEVDGGQHLESDRDAKRDAALAAAGFRTVRFWNDDVLLRTDVVVEAIYVALHAAASNRALPTNSIATQEPIPTDNPSPPPPLPLKGRGGV